MYQGVSPYACVAGGRLAKIAAITNPDYPVELDPLPDHLVVETLKALHFHKTYKNYCSFMILKYLTEFREHQWGNKAVT